MLIVTTADTQGRQGGVQIIYDTLWNTILRGTPDVSRQGSSGNELAVRGCNSGSPGRNNDGWYELPQVFLKGVKQDELQRSVDGRTIKVPENENGFKSFKLSFEADGGCLTYENGTGVHCLQFGIGHNAETVFPDYGHRALVSAAWKNENTFLIYAQIIDEYVGKVFMSFSFAGAHVGIMLKKIEETYYKEFNLLTSGELQ